MSNYGFYIRKLIVTGDNLVDVNVTFSKGMNVISGPSDTGKSYIFESISYMLGASDKPKEIDESLGYSSILMEIELYNGEVYTLKRVLGKKTVQIYIGSGTKIEKGEPFEIKIKHNKDKSDNLSAFLLEKSGFKHPSYLLSKKTESKVRTLSFRDLPPYFSISEDKIIKSDSPIFSGQYAKKTVEKSVFKLILSSIDDSDKNSNEEEYTIPLSRLEGQKELIERLLNQEEKELLELPPSEDSETVELDIESQMTKINDELQNISIEINNHTDERRILWNEIEEDKSKVIALDELIKRFNLLKQQYQLDLERLSFIREGNHYFSQLNFSFCPFCNKNLKEAYCDTVQCGFNTDSDSKLIGAVEAEIKKINLQLFDLKSTITENEVEREELLTRIRENESKYEKLNNKLTEILEPRRTNLKTLLDSYIEQRDTSIKHRLRLEKIEELNKEKTLIENKLKKQTETESVTVEPNTGLILKAYNDFCTYMEKTLKRWHFSQKPTVTFDKDKGFFYIDSKLTKDYGKGYRAIIYSAFVISLMRYCKDKNLPHPGFVLLDSPLTTYKGKKANEDVKMDIQSAFFEDFTTLHKDMQVIILENKEPKEEVKEKINYIEFTKDEKEGRYGFFSKS
ncbi:AAA family ATPase [Bacillus inaquosorum]|uniref:AAA family ATPase n=1 Tax=Bacillus inaquosorum TaxID=483913 RepID=UPI0022830F19|nr:AAA family ATPase [Bacillus inaquosorum]MCY8789784.1 AAA family ATPase [Bacillus inaquosorum]